MLLDEYRDKLDRGILINLDGPETCVIISKCVHGYRFVSYFRREVYPKINFIACSSDWEDFKERVFSKIVASALKNI